MIRARPKTISGCGQYMTGASSVVLFATAFGLLALAERAPLRFEQQPEPARCTLSAAYMLVR
jgi:hypothetical protein